MNTSNNKDTLPNTQKIFRVTEVLSPYVDFSHIEPKVLAHAADRGTRVHRYCEAYALNLFLGDVDDDCKNYFDAYREWFDAMVKEVIHVEIPIESSAFRLKTHGVDLIAILKGDTKPSIIDLKTPEANQDSWALQTAAYSILTQTELGIIPHRRMCLKLPKQPGAAKVSEYTEHARDEDLFLSALKLKIFFEG